jgi:hypothetical protein
VSKGPFWADYSYNSLVVCHIFNYKLSKKKKKIKKLNIKGQRKIIIIILKKKTKRKKIYKGMARGPKWPRPASIFRFSQICPSSFVFFKHPSHSRDATPHAVC